MEETQIKGNILENGLSLMEIELECWAIPAIVVDSEVRGTTLQKLLQVKSEKVKVKWRIFWSLIFFVFGYVKGGVLGNNNISIKKCTTTFLWE